MRKRLLAILIVLMAAALLAPTTGCLVQTKPGHSHHAVKPKKAKKCKPSQYWDGRQCRHKGKGKGSRKHDD